MPEAHAAAPANVADAGQVIARWNDRIGRNRVRVFTVDRLAAIRRALETFGIERVLAAIDFYGGQSWQRKKGAWKTFDRFLEIPTLTTWVEQMLEAAEKADERRPTRDPRVAALQQRLAESRAVQDRWDGLDRDFRQLPGPEQAELLHAAGRELRAIHPHWRIGAKMIRRQALAILERQGKESKR